MILPVNSITPCPDNVRSNEFENTDAFNELKEDIESNGLINPITVRKTCQGYEVVAGSRRFRAAVALGLDSIECNVVDVDDEGAFLMALAENMHRQPMAYADRCRAIARCFEMCERDTKEVARRVCMSGKTIRRYLTIAGLDPELLLRLDAKGDERLTLEKAYRVAKGEDTLDDSDVDDDKNDDFNANRPDTGPNAAAPSPERPAKRQFNLDQNDNGDDDGEQKKRKKSIKSEPWIYDHNNKPVSIPEDIQNKVYSMVRSAAC